MKTIANLLVFCLWLLPSAVSAQDNNSANDPSKVGFIRLVNLAAAGEGNLNFKLDGSSLYTKGYKLGQMTGGLGYTEGKKLLVAKKKGCRDAQRTINIQPGVTQTFVTYTEPIRDEEGRIIDWKIKITRLMQKTPERGYVVTIVSLCPEKELIPIIKAQGRRAPIKVTVRSRQVAAVKLGNGRGDVSIHLGGKKLVGFSTDDPGNYVIMIYNKPDGSKAAIQYYDPKFMVAG